VPALVLLSLLAAGPSADAGPPDLSDTAVTIAQALVASDVEKLVALTPAGFAFDGRQAWNQEDIRSEWTHALERRSLKGVIPGPPEVLGDDEMIKRYGPPPERWAKFNLGGSRIAIVDLGGRALLVIFRRKGDGWVLLGVSD
jgi:hypothetical protein